MGDLLIPDVSEWQGNVNFSEMRRQGNVGCLVRCAVQAGSTLRADHWFSAGRVRAMDAAGLVAGYYAYLVPGHESPEHDADFCWSLLEAVRAPHYRPLAFVVDTEESRLSIAATREYGSRFDERMHHHSGRGCISYDPNWFWGDRGAPKDGAMYWASEYPSRLFRGRPFTWQRPRIPRGFITNPYFWQFSDRARVAGVSGGCDLSVFRGSQRQLNGMRLR